MTRKERRLWARWLGRTYRKRPKIRFLHGEAFDGVMYAVRSRYYEMHCVLSDFAEAYVFMRNRRLGMTIREAWMNCRWGYVRAFLEFPSNEWRKRYGRD